MLLFLLCILLSYFSLAVDNKTRKEEDLWDEGRRKEPHDIFVLCAGMKFEIHWYQEMSLYQFPPPP